MNFPEGERKAEQKDKDKKYHCLERRYGTFQRSFTLPEGTVLEKISAAFKDGVSLVHLPKDEKAIPRAKKSRSIDRKSPSKQKTLGVLTAPELVARSTFKKMRPALQTEAFYGDTNQTDQIFE